MSAFSQLKQSDGTLVDFEPKVAPPPKRPRRWALSNWPVRWKVFAIVLVPLVLAGAFGGLRIYSSVTETTDLRRAADRAEMVPAIVDYMAALKAAVGDSTGGDPQAALNEFDSSRQQLQRRLSDTDVADRRQQGRHEHAGQRAGPDGQGHIQQHRPGDTVTTYAPILLTAEDAINGSVRVDDEQIRPQALGLSRAIGARGQMLMQQLLVNLGAELPEPELRTPMITLAGTEPSTLFGMSQVLGVGSTEAQTCRTRWSGAWRSCPIRRLCWSTIPICASPKGSPTRSPGRSSTDATTSVTTTLEEQASAQRAAAIRDAAIVGVAILIALSVVHAGGAVARSAAAAAAGQRAAGGPRRPGPRNRARAFR